MSNFLFWVPAQPVNATPVLSRSARTRQPQSRKVVPGSRVQPRIVLYYLSVVVFGRSGVVVFGRG